MLVESERLFLLKLRHLLLSNYLYIVILLFSLTFALISTKMITRVSIYDDDTNEIKGIIKDYEFDGDQLKILIASKENIRATYKIKTKQEKQSLIKKIKYGYNITSSGELNIPSNNTIPNVFNYRQYLYHQGIFYQQTIDNLEVTKNNNPFYLIKNFIVNRIENQTITKGYLYTFILGSKKELDQDFYAKLQSNGVVHLFAVSGMHVTLLSGILLFLLKKRSEFKKCLIINTFLLLYGFITAFPASLLRAGIFFFLSSINRLYYFHIKPINILILTVIVNIFINPFVIYDIGFQFSVISVAGLLILSNFISKGPFIFKLFKTTLVATIFSLPITLANFYTVNIITFVANIIFVPIITIIVYPLTILIVILPFLNIILEFLVIILAVINNFLAEIKWFIINVPFNKYYYIIIYYMLLFLFISFKKRFLLGLIFVYLLIIKYSYIIDNNAYIYFLDVGQGDSALIITPYRQKVIMIDTGGKMSFQKESWQIAKNNYNLSDNIIIFLKSIGITTIDILIITHGDQDHMGEIFNYLNKINISDIYLNQGAKNENEAKLIAKQGQLTLNNDLYYLQTLNSKDYHNENDNSIVTYLKIYDQQLLFTGDISQQVELDIINNYDLEIDIIKVGHHGSKTSSNKFFLSVLEPEYAIISAGRNNRFNHPSPETITTLNELKITTYNTQTNGTIQFTINQQRIHLTFYPP